MANPNIVGVTTIFGKTIGVSGLSTNSGLVGILTNSASSDTVYKINNIRATNLSSTLDSSIRLGISQVSTATTYYFAGDVDVPANASLIVIDKNSSFYLEENYEIIGYCGVVGCDIIVSYEEIK